MSELSSTRELADLVNSHFINQEFTADSSFCRRAIYRYQINFEKLKGRLYLRPEHVNTYLWFACFWLDQINREREKLRPIKLLMKKPRKHQIVLEVLGKIASNYPSDYRRLQQRIIEILPIDNNDDITQGEWIHDFTCIDRSDHRNLWMSDLDVPGRIFLNEKVPNEEFKGIVAHELGHAATREQDLDRRGDANDELRSELSADWYAYKWGFGRLIAKFRSTRDWMHHGPPPGSWFEERGIKFRITRNFVVRREQIASTQN